MNTRKNFFESYFFLAGASVLFLNLLFACNPNNTLSDYKGMPFEDDVYQLGAQKIPGRLQCEYYDFGGEGVAFHDNDTINSGSGGLNVADGSYLHEFRKTEAVDISYTKFWDPPVDNSAYNLVAPEKEDLYVGWTEPGEWIKYSIDVKQTGTYALGLMYTANQDGKVSFAVNDQIIIDSVLIPSTYVEEDTVGWRQWHHWNYLESMATLELEKGLQSFTIHTVETGNMNYNYINFKLLE